MKLLAYGKGYMKNTKRKGLEVAPTASNPEVHF